MHIIRSEQTAFFSDDLILKFARQIFPDMKAAHAEAVAGGTDTAWLARLTDCIHEAHAYGFTQDRDIISFVELSLSLGGDFMRQNDVHQLLADQSIRPHERMGLMLLALT